MNRLKTLLPLLLLSLLLLAPSVRTEAAPEADPAPSAAQSEAAPETWKKNWLWMLPAALAIGGGGSAVLRRLFTGTEQRISQELAQDEAAQEAETRERNPERIGKPS